MNNSTLVMIAVLAAVAMLAAVVVVPIQQASAQDTSFSFKQRQSNECSGNAGCGNTGTITFSTRPPDCMSIC
jgi:Flp pilus assembly protein CpaB